MNRVQIRAATGNSRNRPVPERLGFELEGVARQAELVAEAYHDLAVYSMLVSQWSAGSVSAPPSSP